MNIPEFKNIMRIARSAQDLSMINIDHLFGFGLKDFQQVSTSPEAVARMVRWQAHCFDGTWDETAIDEIRYCGKKKFIIL